MVSEASAFIPPCRTQSDNSTARRKTADKRALLAIWVRVVTAVEISTLALSDTSNKAIIASGSEKPWYRVASLSYRCEAEAKPAVSIGIE